MLSIHTPLHPQTQNLFDDDLIGAMKRGSYIVDTARALIVNRDAVVRALNSGQLAGYAGDVWYPRPATARPPLAHHAVRGDDAARVRLDPLGAGPLRRRFPGRSWNAGSTGAPCRPEYLIVDGGGLAGTGARSYTVAG